MVSCRSIAKVKRVVLRSWVWLYHGLQHSYHLLLNETPAGCLATCRSRQRFPSFSLRISHVFHKPSSWALSACMACSRGRHRKSKNHRQLGCARLPCMSSRMCDRPRFYRFKTEGGQVRERLHAQRPSSSHGRQVLIHNFLTRHCISCSKRRPLPTYLRSV